MFNTIWQFWLISKQRIIYKGNTGDPVSVTLIAGTLYIVLASRKIPHKITPVHKSHLICKKPLEVICIGRDFNCNGSSRLKYLSPLNSWSKIIWDLIGIRLARLVLRLYYSITYCCYLAKLSMCISASVERYNAYGCHGCYRTRCWASVITCASFCISLRVSWVWRSNTAR